MIILSELQWRMCSIRSPRLSRCRTATAKRSAPPALSGKFWACEAWKYQKVFSISKMLRCGEWEVNAHPQPSSMRAWQDQSNSAGLHSETFRQAHEELLLSLLLLLLGLCGGTSREVGSQVQPWGSILWWWAWFSSCKAQSYPTVTLLPMTYAHHTAVCQAKQYIGTRCSIQKQAPVESPGWPT